MEIVRDESQSVERTDQQLQEDAMQEAANDVDMKSIRGEQSVDFIQVLDENGNPLKQPDSTLTTTSSEQIPVAKDMKEIVEEKAVSVEEFMSSKENQDKAFQLALQMFDIMGSKAFTLDKAVKKMGMEKVVTFQKLKLLEMFGYCLISKGDPMESRERNETMFRLTVALEHKITALKAVIKVKQEEIDSLNTMLKVWEANKPKVDPFSSAMTNVETEDEPSPQQA